MSLLAFALPGQAAEKLNYTTSWIGNTYGGLNDVKIPDFIMGMYVAPDGTVYTNTGWEEANANVSVISRDGTPGPRGIKGWGHETGRTTGAVTADDRYIYHSIRNGFRRTVKNAPKYPAEFDLYLQDGSHTIRGLAAADGELFVSDVEANLVRVYDTKTMKEVRSFPFQQPGRIAVEPNGDLWIIRMTDNVRGTGIYRVSRRGEMRPQSITDVDNPVALALDPKGRLLVADRGPEQRYRIYKNIAAQPVLDRTFGVKGGIFAPPVVGKVGPLRFHGPIGIGTDANGDIYTAGHGTWNAGGAVVERYSPDGKRKWVRQGLMFEDAVGVDPASDGREVYGLQQRYRMNYSKGWGKDWEYMGFTLNPYKYPHDVRMYVKEIHEPAGWAVSAWIRRINGHLLQIVSSQTGNMFSVYRFNRATDGETAIPSAYLSTDHIKSDVYPPHQPKTGAWYWRDEDGDGQMEGSEYQSIPEEIPDEGKSMDTKGDIWIAVETTITHLPLKGFDRHGNPIYRLSERRTMKGPQPFTDIARIEYDPERDFMVLTGYTKELPEETWGLIGNAVAGYENWSQGNRTPKWVTTDLDERFPTKSWQERHSPKSIAVEGDYFFIAYFGGVDVGGVRVHDVHTGKFVGKLLPPEDLKVADVDKYYGVHAFQRKNGEYLVFNSDHYYGKQTVFRWKPDAKAGPAKGLSRTP